MEYTIVESVPSREAKARTSKWAEIIAKVPETGAIAMEFENGSKASNQAGSLRNYLKAQKIEGLQVSRRGAKVYLAKAPTS